MIDGRILLAIVVAAILLLRLLIRAGERRYQEHLDRAELNRRHRLERIYQEEVDAERYARNRREQRRRGPSEDDVADVILGEPMTPDRWN